MRFVRCRYETRSEDIPERRRCEKCGKRVEFITSDSAYYLLVSYGESQYGEKKVKKEIMCPGCYMRVLAELSLVGEERYMVFDCWKALMVAESKDDWEWLVEHYGNDRIRREG